MVALGLVGTSPVAAAMTKTTYITSVYVYRADFPGINNSLAFVAGFEEAGLPSTPTTSAGTQYTLPDRSLVRVIEPSGQAGLRASCTNTNGGPCSEARGGSVDPVAEFPCFEFITIPHEPHDSIESPVRSGDLRIIGWGEMYWTREEAEHHRFD